MHLSFGNEPSILITYMCFSCTVPNHKSPVLLSVPNEVPPPLPPPPVFLNEENKDPRQQQQQQQQAAAELETTEDHALSAEFQNEIGGIINQLSEFKTELLKLHGVVSL